MQTKFSKQCFKTGTMAVYKLLDMSLYKTPLLAFFKTLKPSLTKTIYLLFLAMSLSACNLTDTKQSQHVADLNQGQFVRIEPACIQQVERQKATLTTATASQYKMMANTAENCISNIAFSPKHPDIELAMQFSALAFVNNIKAGDITSATQSLSLFRQRFPQQDLIFEDFTSFVDTASVLVSGEAISQQDLAMMNINANLRAELERKRIWTLN